MYIYNNIINFLEISEKIAKYSQKLNKTKGPHRYFLVPVHYGFLSLGRGSVSKLALFVMFFGSEGLNIDGI